MTDDALPNGQGEDKGAPKWVVTFGDLMSLLLCFFVLLLSFSEMDRQKYRIVAGSLAQAFGIQRQDRSKMDSPRGAKMVALSFDQDLMPKYNKEEFIATQMMETLGRELKEALEGKMRGLEDKIEIESKGNQITIRLLGGATFDSGQARIKPELIPILEEIGIRLKDSQGDIAIAGHTDNVPVLGGPYESNLKLSIARAAEVAEFLIEKVQIPPDRIVTMGYGEYRPSHTNATEAGREKNRRVEIILTAMPRPIPPDAEAPPDPAGATTAPPPQAESSDG
jgi:chemotaxis protein MotB